MRDAPYIQIALPKYWEKPNNINKTDPKEIDYTKINKTITNLLQTLDAFLTAHPPQPGVIYAIDTSIDIYKMSRKSYNLSKSNVILAMSNLYSQNYAFSQNNESFKKYHPLIHTEIGRQTKEIDYLVNLFSCKYKETQQIMAYIVSHSIHKEQTKRGALRAAHESRTTYPNNIEQIEHLLQELQSRLS